MKDTRVDPISMPDPDDPTATLRIAELGKAKGFLERIGQGWESENRTPRVVKGAAAAAARHRAALSQQFPGETLVVSAGHAPVRSNDAFYDFRPDSNFYWLSGCALEGAVLVLTPAGSGHDATLFIHPAARPGEDGFFSDMNHGELWVGPSPSIAEWTAALDLAVAPMHELGERLKSRDAQVVGSLAKTGLSELPHSTRLMTQLAELRMVKDDWELQQLREAVASTLTGFESVVLEIPAAVEGLGERWLQGTFDRHARTYGNGPGYSTIVGSGHHAPTLHWVTCDGPVRSNELLLLDMGVEVRSFYTADVTRTFPVSGKFSPVQREVHDLVEKAHRAGLEAVRPGNIFGDFHVAVMEAIAEGLHQWGLLPVSVDEALSVDGQEHRRYLACGVGHHLGLDVHDCASSTYSSYQDGALAEGMVLTVEPGLYFHANDLTVPPELRGIGVRIEDDVVVTANGSDVLSDALPIDAAGLESWMVDLFWGPRPADLSVSGVGGNN